MSSEIRSSPIINKIRALPDLRVQPNHVANKQVREKWPGEKDDGQPAGSIHRKHRGLDVLLIVARHILITHPDGRSIETDSNPILELAWKDMESSEYKANIEAIKGEIIHLMASDGHLPDASFASLCESPTMLETLWKEPTLLLCGQLEILSEETEEAEEEWIPHEMIGSDFLSKHSLVTWNGELDLVEQIDRIWYHRRHEDGALLRLTRPETMPACIRVLYQAPPGCQRSERDLLRFELPNGQCYTLLAAVWLRNDNTTPGDDGDNLDFVHIYSPDAADVFPVVASKCTARSPETIGQGGHSYMLFYGEYNAAIAKKNYARCLRSERVQRLMKSTQAISIPHHAWDTPGPDASPPGTQGIYTDTHIGKQTPEKEALWAQFFAADLPKPNLFDQNPFAQLVRGGNAFTRGSVGRGSTPRRAGASIEGISVKLETDSASSTPVSFRGDFRGSSRGNPRGDLRGSSRGGPRDNSQGNIRGNLRGSSQDSPRGSSRGLLRGYSRGSSRGSSRGWGI